MLILSDSDIKGILTGLSRKNAEKILGTLSHALIAYSNDHGLSQQQSRTIHQPVRQVFTTAPGHTTLFMPASNTQSTGIKVATLPGSGGAPKGSINIFSPEGELIGLLNAEEITAFRTALATMIPFLRCPLPKTKLVVFGAGKQAEWHLRLAVLLAGDQIDNVTVVNRGTITVEDTVQRLQDVLQSGEIKCEIVAKDRAGDYEERLQALVADADAIMCCTPSTEPLFPASYTANSKPKFISLIGSYKPNMQEVDSVTVMSGGHIYVDSKEACLEEAGELIMGKVPEENLVEVGSMLSCPEHAPKERQNTIFKCVGMGIMDVAVAAAILQIAQDTGVGRSIDDF